MVFHSNCLKMKQFLLLLGFLAVASAGWKGGLRAKFDYNVNPFNFGSTYFRNVPRTVSDAINEGYTKRTRLPGLHLPTLTLYCPSPAALCGLYDDTGYIAGLQVGVDFFHFKPHLDCEVMGMRKWTTDDGTFWILSEYFISQEFLEKPAASRVSTRNPHTMLQDKSVWVTGTKGQIYEIPRDQKKIDRTDFREEACLPWMGRHYYYNMTSTTECTSEGILPWFPLYDDNELIGMGFMTFGPLPVDKKMDWFERPSVLAVKVIVPSAPQCLYDLATSPGALTMHTYFIENPRMVTCVKVPSLPNLHIPGLPSFDLHVPNPFGK